MAVAGYDGTLWTREQFLDELKRVKFPVGVKFLTLHATWWPNRRVARATPYPGKTMDVDLDKAYAQRIKNLATRASELGGAGPHCYAFENGKIGKGTPMDHWGIHAVGWNHESLALEMVANFSGTVKMSDGQVNEVDDPYTGGGLVILDTAAWVFAQWLRKAGLPANASTIKLHRENPKAMHDGKDCPGKTVNKDDFIKRVQSYMAQDAEAPAVSEGNVDPEVAYVVNVQEGDFLNMRLGPGASYEAKGKLPPGVRVTKLKVVGSWVKIETPAGYQGWVHKAFLGTKKEVEKPLPVESVKIAPVAGAMDRGKYVYSEFAIAWAKRFEGLMLVSYWDRGDYAIGYGHNNASNVPPAVAKDMTITEVEAVKILHSDMDLQANYLNKLATVPLTQGQIDALCLHIFQQGPGNFRRGNVLPLVNAGKHQEAADMIENWPTTNAGLKRRRGVEAEIYRGKKPTQW